MKALLAVTRILSGSAAPSGPAVSTGTHLIELTETQLTEVAGGGGRLHLSDSSNYNGTAPVAQGSKGIVTVDV
jgi:hypothetical protein